MPADEKTRHEVVPLVRHDFISRSGIRFTSACFQGADWSLGPLQRPEDVTANRPLAHKLSGALKHLGADRAFAPSPVKFNGRVILPEQLLLALNLGGGIFLMRNQNAPADGTLLRSPRDAGIFSAGGCGLVVAALGEHMVFAHAGRDCVIDRRRVLSGTPSRELESVVDYVVNALLLAAAPCKAEDIQVWVLYSIRADDFLHRYDHEEHGEYNRLIGPDLESRGLGVGYHRSSEGVSLDMPVVIREQFLRRGVPSESVSLEHGYLADELPTTRNGGGRYLAAVVRHS